LDNVTVCHNLLRPDSKTLREPQGKQIRQGSKLGSTEKTNSDGLYVLDVELRVESSASKKPAEKLNVNLAGESANEIKFASKNVIRKVSLCSATTSENQAWYGAGTPHPTALSGFAYPAARKQCLS
jgi:hypothetical protein